MSESNSTSSNDERSETDDRRIDAVIPRADDASDKHRESAQQSTATTTDSESAADSGGSEDEAPAETDQVDREIREAGLEQAKQHLEQVAEQSESSDQAEWVTTAAEAVSSKAEQAQARLQQARSRKQSLARQHRELVDSHDALTEIIQGMNDPRCPDRDVTRQYVGFAASVPSKEGRQDLQETLAARRDSVAEDLDEATEQVAQFDRAAKVFQVAAEDLDQKRAALADLPARQSTTGSAGGAPNESRPQSTPANGDRLEQERDIRGASLFGGGD